MKLFELSKDWVLNVSEEAWGIPVFKKILDKDKSKGKEKALKEMLFIYFYCDIKSDYIITPEESRVTEIKKDIGLPTNWEISKELQAAIDFYNKHNKSIVMKLYESSVQSANDVAEYLKNTKTLLDERNEKGMPITNVSQITSALKGVPTIMKDLKSAYKEVIMEVQDSTGKNKGKQSYNTFEEGLF